MSTPTPPPRHPPRPRRHRAQPFPGDLRGAVPHLRLRLRQRRAGRGDVHRGDQTITSTRGSPTRPLPCWRSGWRRSRGRRHAGRTATGMAAVNCALMSHLKAGDRVVASRALFGGCHWIVSTLLPRFGIETEFVDGADLDQWRARARPADPARAAGNPVEPDAGDGRSARRLRPRARIRRARRGRQRVRDAAAAAAARARRRRGGLFGDQAYRRAGPGDGRRRARAQGLDHGHACSPSCATPGRRWRRSTPGCC